MLRMANANISTVLTPGEVPYRFQNRLIALEDGQDELLFVSAVFYVGITIVSFGLNDAVSIGAPPAGLE